MIASSVVVDDAEAVVAERTRGSTWKLAAVGIVVVVFALYARTINEGLYLDDQHHVRPWTMGEVLGTFHGPFDPLGIEPVYFRPLVVVTFALDWAAWGYDAVGYHITNVALHALACVAVLALLRSLRLAWWAAVAGALLFAAIPANAATAVYISERSDAMVAIFTIAGVLCVCQYASRRAVGWLVLLNVCFALAIGAKEVGIAMILTIVVVWWYLQLPPTPATTDGRATRSVLDHWRSELRLFATPLLERRYRADWLKVVGPMAVVAIASIAYRALVLPTGALGSRYTETNPLRAFAAAVADTFAGVPWELSTRTLPILAAVIVLAFIVAPRAPTWRVVVLGVAWVLTTCIPLAYLGQVEPRLLYVAQVGVAIVFAGVLTILVGASRSADGTWRPLVAVPTALLVVIFGAASIMSTFDAQDQFTPGSAKMLNADLGIWENVETRDRWPAHHLEQIRQRLLDAGLITADGAIVEADAAPDD